MKEWILKKRNFWFHIIMTYFTCGIWAIIYFYCKSKFDTQITQRDEYTNNLSIVNQTENEISALEIQKKNLIKEISTLTEKRNSLDIQIKNREKFYVETELKYIDTLEGIEFEHYMAQLLIKLGYTTKVTQSTQDDGADVLAEKDGIKYVFQCKNYSSTVGNKAVQEVYSAKGIYKYDKGIVVTNNFFTRQAEQTASSLDIDLWDRNSLKVLLYQAFGFEFTHLDNLTSKYYDKELAQEYEEDDEPDPLLMEAIDEVVSSGQASTSYIQRKFQIGYARAGRIIDQMEERGIISGYQGSEPRKVLITPQRLQELKMN